MTRIAMTLSLIFAASVHAALPTLRADVEENWGKDGVSVVVAELQAVQAADDAKYHHQLKLAPIATVSGTFDCGSHSSLEGVDVYVGPTGSSITTLPNVGDKVLAVITPVRGHFGVLTHLCRFMPGSSALVKVDGLDDPKVKQTLHNIQEARGKGRGARPTATQPS